MLISRLKKYVLYFLILVYVSGSVGCFVRPSFFMPFTPLALLLTLLCFLLHQPFYMMRYTLAFFALALSGFFLEVAGVKTDLIFGKYTYGNTLGIKVLGVPLLISANWALLINCGILLAPYWSKKPFTAAFISALLVTITDLVIEQVACKIDYWCFANGKAGFHNYLGWFIFSYIASYLLRNVLYTSQLKIAGIILLLQWLYFISINISVLKILYITA